MSSRLDIDALKALIAIDEHGGVTRASEHLSLSQSAVSHKIRRLEENIGSKLLNRRAGAPLLTETGQRLLGYAKRILSLHDEALISLSQRSIAGKIRLGMTEDITSSGLTRILGRFARLHRDVEVRTHVEQSLVLQRQLDAGQIDMAVLQVFTSDVSTSDRILFKDQLIWAKSKDIDIDVSRPIPFLSYDDNCFYRKWMQEKVACENLAFRTVLECSSNRGIVEGIEAGLGVSLISRRLLTNGVEELMDVFANPPEITYVVRQSSGPGSVAIKALTEEIGRESNTVLHLNAAWRGFGKNAVPFDEIVGL